MKCSEVAALIHADMCDDERNGYDWGTRWGGDHPDGAKTLVIDGLGYTYRLGGRDCSSSVIEACRLAIQYTPYAGALDGATYTGNMRSVFLGSGLFWADRTPAKRGDVYLNDSSHTAMCQDGGSDGVYGYDAMSQFSINEYGTVYGGQVGDQTGAESYIGPFSEFPWSTTLHWVDVEAGSSDTPVPPTPAPVPDPGDALLVDGLVGPNTVRKWQAQMGTPVDGTISGQWPGNAQYLAALTSVEWGEGGSQLVARVQRAVGATEDGYIGPDTVRAVQSWLAARGYDVGASGVDGYFGNDTATALQHSLNDGVWCGL
jgi:peptidoglycan hydrolase-like protein with peptidoglycan-binding domain